ncbi:DNA-3-methyladenine glycosylase I [Duganella sp. CF458]|uniref:DNA-3-methyladenine glycosylase I n=1 Tax=Duganella sp. CF458 TaxID=1884368 RepID=UPI0008E39487|nr:DNA-3-methyladenine glycosylase I [Duganella sp. CF458]SFG19011.1 DNA-3-methyladenine glycosylase I [Duganella sp. CF458]
MSTHRCSWANPNNPRYIAYHDQEWGVPCRDELRLFEMLNLEGAQAGLSWETILNKRDNYRAAFDGWDARKIAAYDEAKIGQLLSDPGIVRNRLKVNAAVTNARAYLRLLEEGGSLSSLLWGYVGGKPIVNRIAAQGERPAHTELSDRISKDLAKRGFKFVGSTIIYAYMQGIGMVNDHDLACFRHKECQQGG